MKRIVEEVINKTEITVERTYVEENDGTYTAFVRVIIPGQELPVFFRTTEEFGEEFFGEELKDDWGQLSYDSEGKPFRYVDVTVYCDPDLETVKKEAERYIQLQMIALISVVERNCNEKLQNPVVHVERQKGESEWKQ